MESKTEQAFAVWITGLPASGKSTIAGSLKTLLNERGVDVAVLESDVLRKIFSENPRYGELDRDVFYRRMIWVGVLLTQHGVPVIFDATANRRAYRDEARSKIPKFVEVFVDTPLRTCIERDPKGIYRSAAEGRASDVPGMQAAYENPDLVINGTREAPLGRGPPYYRRLAGPIAACWLLIFKYSNILCLYGRCAPAVQE